LALAAALFVIALRCLGSFAPLTWPLLLAQAGTQIDPASAPSADPDAVSPVAVEDDSDDDTPDPFIAPSPLEFRPLSKAAVSAGQCCFIAEARPLPGHAPSLERPPRA
jgi:hypothetical protein